MALLKVLSEDQGKTAEEVAINLLRRAPFALVVASQPRGVVADEEGRPAFLMNHNWWMKGYQFQDPGHRRVIAAAFRAILDQIEAEWGEIPSDLGHWS